MELDRASVGSHAFEFELEDQTHRRVRLQDLLTGGPLMLVFYPGDFTPVCTKQLCNYRDNFDKFRRIGVQIIGVSSNTPEDHTRFSKEYDFPFPLLSDPKREVAKAYGCTSILLLGGVSRAVIIIGRNGSIVYRYVEPTPLTHRKADALVEILEDLKRRGSL